MDTSISADTVNALIRYDELKDMINDLYDYKSRYYTMIVSSIHMLTKNRCDLLEGEAQRIDKLIEIYEDQTFQINEIHAKAEALRLLGVEGKSIDLAIAQRVTSHLSHRMPYDK